MLVQAYMKVVSSMRRLSLWRRRQWEHLGGMGRPWGVLARVCKPWWCALNWFHGHMSPQESVISCQHLTTSGLDVVTSVWTNTHNNAIYVPQFTSGVLKGNIGANLSLWEGSGVLVVVLFNLLWVRQCFLVSSSALRCHSGAKALGGLEVCPGRAVQTAVQLTGHPCVRVCYGIEVGPWPTCPCQGGCPSSMLQWASSSTFCHCFVGTVGMMWCAGIPTLWRSLGNILEVNCGFGLTRGYLAPPSGRNLSWGQWLIGVWWYCGPCGWHQASPSSNPPGWGNPVRHRSRNLLQVPEMVVLVWVWWWWVPEG